MRVTMDVDARWLCLVLLNFLVMIGTAYAGKGIIRCDCTTQECIDEGKTTCVGRKMCYAQLYQGKLTKGCDPNGLSCDYRRPSRVNLDVEWPKLHCCKDKDLCNKNIIPSDPESTEDIPDIPPFIQENQALSNDHSSNSDNNVNNLQQAEKELCPHTKGASSSSSSSSNPSSIPQPKTKIINPIYIAVPVAGVCVLLALIIFAMYLLRRRTVYHHGHHHGHHHHENFHHYHHQHDHVPELSHKQTVVPPPHPHHHCQCVCKKQTSLPPCSKSNRCTESERSSSGSETKLFLQT